MSNPGSGTKNAGSGSRAPAADEAGQSQSGKLLRHAVFFAFKESSSEEDIQGVAAAFAALPSKIDSIVDFQWGTNNSPEEHDDGFTHCFLLSFADEAGRETYLPHPAHKGEFAGVLGPHMKDVFVNLTRLNFSESLKNSATFSYCLKISGIVSSFS